MVVKKITSLKPKSFFSIIDYGILINTLLLIIGSGFVLFFFQDQFQEIRTIRFNSTFGSILFYFAMFVLAFKLLFFIFLLVHFLKYKPIESVKDDELPSITLIVPAYDEGSF